MPIIDSQIHAYEANTPKRPWDSAPNWPPHVTGDEIVAAMDKVGVDGAIFISSFSMYRYDASYAVEVQRGASRPLRAREAGRSRRSRGSRRHRRVEEDAGHRRHSHHDHERAGARPGPIPASIASRAQPPVTISR